jgi:hypothetical protein
MNSKDKIRTTAAEMRFTRRTAKYTKMGYKRNEDSKGTESRTSIGKNWEI